MLDTLRSAQARRVLISFSTVVAVVLLAIQGLSTYLLLSAEESSSDGWGAVGLTTIQMVASGLFGGVAAAAYIAFFARYLLREEGSLRQIEITDSLTSRRAHLSALERTENWRHNGHIGRWVRTTVFPKFSMSAREGAYRNVYLILIDPRNLATIHAYAEHRDQVDAIPVGIDTRHDARVEILATILRSAVVMQNTPGVRAHVSLRSDLSLFRTDLSDSRAFVTLTRDKVPTIVFNHLEHDSAHYWAAMRDFEIAFEIGESVDLQAAPLSSEPGLPEVRAFIDAIGMAEFLDLAEEAIQRSKSDFNRTP